MIHVYELPEKAPMVGYLFNGGKPVEFLMVDWFNEPEEMTLMEDAPAMGRPELETFLRGKRYVKPGRRYLIVADARTDLTFVMEPTP